MGIVLLADKKDHGIPVLNRLIAQRISENGGQKGDLLSAKISGRRTLVVALRPQIAIESQARPET